MLFISSNLAQKLDAPAPVAGARSRRVDSVASTTRGALARACARARRFERGDGAVGCAQEAQRGGADLAFRSCGFAIRPCRGQKPIPEPQTQKRGLRYEGWLRTGRQEGRPRPCSTVMNWSASTPRRLVHLTRGTGAGRSVRCNWNRSAPRGSDGGGESGSIFTLSCGMNEARRLRRPARMGRPPLRPLG